MNESLHDQAQRAIGLVAESACPLCHLELRIHDGRACCRCCGDSYVVAANRLDVKPCPIHATTCEHWRRLFADVGTG